MAETLARQSRPAPLPALTSLRFVAAMGIVLRHFGGLVRYPAPLSTALAQGRLGVNFFFVLSGFVLAYNYLDWFDAGLDQWRLFLWQRFARIYPLALAGILVMTPISLLTLNRLGPLAATMTAPRLALSWVVDLLQLQTLYPKPSLMLLWDDPLWSISAEMVFYVSFPFFVRWIVRPGSGQRRLGLLGISLIAIQLALVTAATPLGHNGALVRGMSFSGFDEFTYKSPFFRIWEFFLGVTLGAALLGTLRGDDGPLAILLRSERARNVLVVACLAGLIAIAATPHFLGPRNIPHLYEWTWFAFPTPLFLMLISAIATGGTALTRWLGARWLVLLGEASFALYALHWIPLTLITQWHNDGHAVPAIVPVALIGGTVAVSILSFKWVEVPSRTALRKLARRWAWGRPRFAPMPVQRDAVVLPALVSE